MLGAGMPLASYPLFHNLGIDWGNTLLGFVSLLLIPIPSVSHCTMLTPEKRLLADARQDGFSLGMATDCETCRPWLFTMISSRN